MKKLLFAVLLFLCINSIDGQKLASWKINDVVSHFTKKTDSIYIVNFWATYCKPCVQEIPYLQSITKKYSDQKVALLLVSLDLAAFYPGKIKSFAKKNDFTADMVWLNESDADYFCPVIDKNWSGAIPATLFVNSRTGYRQFVEAEMSREVFETELKKAIAGK